MRLSVTKLLFLVIAALLYITSSTTVYAQGVTTASISGTVTDENGAALPSANIMAVHNPTGTSYGTTTRNDGRYNLIGLRVGGPYTITVSFVGYETQKKEDVYLELGQNLTLNFKMTTSAVKLSEVTVVGTSNAIISSERTGASERVSAREIQQIPTISRSLTDLTKLSPLFSGLGYSAAGRNNRYNNIQLNGTQFNDLFGLNSGAPGSGQGANAISLDEIQEFQIVVAPYDVRYGGFTGGGINAITRSGTNAWDGSAYGFGRTQGLVGLSPDTKKQKLADFQNFQEGFRLGGPIVQDKMFFFINGELTQYTYPLPNISLSPQGSAGMAAYADTVQNILMSKYNYNPGTMDSYNASQPSGKVFARFDWNISQQHKLTLSYSYLNAKSDNDYSYTRSGNTSLSYDSYLYLYKNQTNNTVLQLNSTFSNNMSNELILGYTTIRDNRGPEGSNPLPLVQVNINNLKIYGGLDRYSSANFLGQNIFEFTDNFNYSAGDHLFTFGTHNEFFNFTNLFMASYFGWYTFNSLADLNAGKIGGYQRTFSRTNDPQQAASFSVNQFGLYAQDEWSVMPNFKLTYGIRFDLPTLPTAAAKNDSVSYYFPGFSTTDKPNANILFSPRVGFNYDLNGDKETQIRGGIGIFSGRVPYVWLSNNYGGTGTYYAVINGAPKTNAFSGGFSADPYNQPSAVGLGLSPKLSSEIDLADPNLKMPQLLRFNAAVDKKLPYDFIGTIELLYSKNINEMNYQLVNLKGQTGVGEGGRPIFGGTNSGNGNFYNILYLTNTNKGYQYNFVAQIQRNVLRGVSVNAGYTYGRAFDINSVNSSQANSQLAYSPISGDPNNPPVATSDYEIRNRIFASVTYTEEFFKDAPTSISLFYNGQSGRPFSFTVYGDINSDGYNQNDLFYIPKNDGDIELGSITGGKFVSNAQMYSDFDSFVANNDYLNSHRGIIAGRNEAKNPWYNQLDMRIVQDLPVVYGHSVEITLDILNVLNLINSDWGWYQHTTQSTYTIVNLVGKDPATGKNVYSFSKPATNTPWSADNLISRWAMQFGVRFTL